jgi:hypothetical protein
MQPDILTTVDYLGHLFPVAVFIEGDEFVGTASWLEDNYHCTAQEPTLSQTLAVLRDQLAFMAQYWLDEQLAA